MSPISEPKHFKAVNKLQKKKKLISSFSDNAVTKMSPRGWIYFSTFYCTCIINFFFCGLFISNQFGTGNTTEII